MTQSQFVFLVTSTNQPTQPNPNPSDVPIQNWHSSDLLIGQDTMMLDGTPGPYPVTAPTRNHFLGAKKTMVRKVRLGSLPQ